MNLIKRILYNIIFPHMVIVALTVPVAAAMLIYAFCVSGTKVWIIYLLYFFSAYSLTIVCARSPEIYAKIKNFKENNAFVIRYTSDVQLRVKTSLYGSLIMNAAYSIFQLILGFYHASVWFYSLAVYYGMLFFMRVFLLRDIKVLTPGENRIKELKRYRFCGVIILLMNLALAIIVFYITWQNRGFVHHPITTIAMAAYTFTSLTMAIVNVVKYRKYQSPMLSASKTISLVSAAVSMLTLETAMLTAFGEGNDYIFRQIMTGATGTAVCIFVLATAIYMVYKSNAEIRKHVKGEFDI